MLFPVLGVKGQMSTAKTPAACTNNGKPVLVIIISHYYTVSPPSVELCICRDRVCLSPGALLQIGPSHGPFSLSLSLPTTSVCPFLAAILALLRNFTGTDYCQPAPLTSLSFITRRSFTFDFFFFCLSPLLDGRGSIDSLLLSCAISSSPPFLTDSVFLG